MPTGSPAALLAPGLQGEQSWGHTWYGCIGTFALCFVTLSPLLAVARDGNWAGCSVGDAITGASSPASRTCRGPDTLMLMAGREQVNEEKPSAPFHSTAAFRSGFAVVYCGDKCLSAYYLCCAHRSPFGRLNSEIRHMLWRNRGWKEKVFPLILFHYWK